MSILLLSQVFYPDVVATAQYVSDLAEHLQLKRNVAVLVECPVFSVPVEMIETALKELETARRKKHNPGQVLNLLRQIEVVVRSYDLVSARTPDGRTAAI